MYRFWVMTKWRPYLAFSTYSRKRWRLLELLWCLCCSCPAGGCWFAAAERLPSSLPGRRGTSWRAGAPAHKHTSASCIHTKVGVMCNVSRFPHSPKNVIGCRWTTPTNNHGKWKQTEGVLLYVMSQIYKYNYYEVFIIKCIKKYHKILY